MLSLNHPKYKDILKAVEYFNENKISITRCASLFNIHRETLAKYLKEFDMHEDRRSYNVNENYFERIDSEEKAYWLGFITADGCLKQNKNQLDIGLSINDHSHLEKFKHSIDSEHPIKTERTVLENNKEYLSSNIGIQNKKLYNDLINLGVTPNKTIHEIPANITEEFISHYIRGIFDGDGWLSWNNNCAELGFGMGYDILNYIRNKAELYACVKYYDIKPFKRIFRYRITSKIEIKKMLEYIYSNANIYLERKHKKYLSFCRPESKSQKAQED